MTRLRDFLVLLSLLRAVWAVRCGRAQRIAVPGKFKVWRNGRVMVVELIP